MVVGVGKKGEGGVVWSKHTVGWYGVVKRGTWWCCSMHYRKGHGEFTVVQKQKREYSPPTKKKKGNLTSSM